jgi:hypothetical protein
MNAYGYKLYNEEHSFFSWHETPEDAARRARYELGTFGRSFQIAAMTEREYRAYPASAFSEAQ